MLKIGEKLQGKGPKDAIHIAVVPVLLGEDMEPGQAIRVVHGKAYKAYRSAIGIVDPYLEYGAFEDDWVYMFLYPNIVSGLRHEWSYRDYDDNEEYQPIPRLNPESVEWLEQFAHEHNTSYDALIVRCAEALTFDSTYKGFDNQIYSWVTFYGRDIHKVPKGFWTHFRKATGWKISRKDTARVEFTCSC